MTSVTFSPQVERIPFQLKSHNYGASSMNNWRTIESRRIQTKPSAVIILCKLGWSWEASKNGEKPCPAGNSPFRNQDVRNRNSAIP